MIVMNVTTCPGQPMTSFTDLMEQLNDAQLYISAPDFGTSTCVSTEDAAEVLTR